MTVLKGKPWLNGIVDTFIGANLINESAIPHKNRLVVVLVDSAFETACRAYLKYKANITLADSHRHRENLINTVKAKLSAIDPEVWDNINYYYQEIRCDLYHQSAGKTITDEALMEYRETIEFVINTAFKIQMADLVHAQRITTKSTEPKETTDDKTEINWKKISTKTDMVLMGVSFTTPQNATELIEYFRKEGTRIKIKGDEFTNIVARNSGSKNYFYFNKELKRWEVTAMGRYKVRQLLDEGKNEQ